MEIRQAQEKIRELLGEIEHPRLASFIALTEEVGEIADEIMKREIYDEKDHIDDLKSEIADTFVALIELANVYGIDIPEPTTLIAHCDNAAGVGKKLGLDGPVIYQSLDVLKRGLSFDGRNFEDSVFKRSIGEILGEQF